MSAALMTADEIRERATVEAGAISPAARRKVVTSAFGEVDEDFAQRRVAAGHWRTVVISADGAPMFRVFFVLNGIGCLMLTAVFSVAENSRMKILELGIESLARKNGCAAIEFCTENRDLMNYALNWGAKICGVEMIKNL